MSTAYNTSAKPRARRDTKSIERASRAVHPNDASQILTKNISRTSDETPGTNYSRPGTPGSHFQRYQIIDREPADAIAGETAQRDVLSSNMGSSSSQERTMEHERAVTTTLVDSSPRSTASSIPGSWPIPLAGKQVAAVPTIAPKTLTPRLMDESLPLRSVPTMAPNSPEKNRAELVSSPAPTVRSTTANSDRNPRSQDEMMTDVRQFEDITSRGRVNAAPYDPRVPYAQYMAYTQNPQSFIAMTRDIDERSSTSAGYSTGSPPRSPPPNHYYPYLPQNPSHYPYMYPQQVMPPGYNMYANPYQTVPPPMEYHPHVVNESRPWRVEGDDEHNRLVERLSGVLPDIDRLLSHYRDTRGQTPIGAIPTQASQTEHSEELRNLQTQVEAKKREYEKVIEDLIGRNNDLEREVSTLRDFEVKADKAMKDTEQVAQEVAQLRTLNEKLIEEAKSKQSSIETLEAEKTDHLKQIASLERQRESSEDLHQQNMRDIREQHKDQLAAISAEREITVADHKVKLSKVQLELANLITKHNSQSKDLEAAVRLEAQRRIEIETNAKRLDELLLQHSQDVKALKCDHQNEVEDLKRREQEERKRTILEAETTRKKLLEDYTNKERCLLDQLTSMQKELENCQNDLRQERDRHLRTKKLLQAHEDTIGDLTKRFVSWNAKQSELQIECKALETWLQSVQHNTESQA